MAGKTVRKQQGIWDPHDRAEPRPAYNSAQPEKAARSVIAKANTTMFARKRR